MDVRPLRRWLATVEDSTVLLACREHPDPQAWCAPGARPEDDGPGVVLLLAGCLGALPAAAVLEILAGGAAGVIGLLDGCGAPEDARRVLGEARAIAQALGLGQPVTEQDAAPGTGPLPSPTPRRGVRRQGPRRRAMSLLDAEHMPVSRRTLLAAPVSDAAGGLSAPEVHPDLRMRAVVGELVGRAPVPAALGDLPSGAALLAAPGCGGTGTCVQACPVEALTLTVTDLSAPSTTTVGPAGRAAHAVPGAARRSAGVEQFVLSVDASRCIGCGICVEVCPEGAMSRVGTVSWTDTLSATPAVLRAGLVRRCTRCGSAHRGEGELCPVCAQHSREPFGSRLPPGFRRPGR